jgi:hypothetical protein
VNSLNPDTVQPAAGGNGERPLWVLCCAPGVLAWFWPPVGVFANFFTLLAFLIRPKQHATSRFFGHALLGAAALGSAVGSVRFVRSEGLQGIVEGGTRAAEQRAVSHLREILFAEDAVRRYAVIDPDHDGVGGYAFLDELSGKRAWRSSAHALKPVLSNEYRSSVADPSGPLTELDGYLFKICLPTASGLSNSPESRIDEEAAERRFVAYAWPVKPELRLFNAFAIDEHDRILVRRPVPPVSGGGELPALAAPSCDAVVSEQTRGDWLPWKGKRPRTSLPGDPAG